MKLFLATLALVSLGIGSAWAGAAEGKAVFDGKCKMCHGADGKGNPGMVKAMGVKPIGGTAEADVKNAVTKGKNKMRPISGLSAKQIDDVAAYVHSLK
ncbi:MAG TPA: cytochrome c [Bryobacteraceae bacterium]|nr:cytochrome c [Bryobacteraceae bacterium]